MLATSDLTMCGGGYTQTRQRAIAEHFATLLASADVGTEFERQAAQSKIISTAHAINAGRMPDFAPPDSAADFYFVPAADPEQAVSRIVELVSKRIPHRFGFDPIRDIQVLCPMNRGGVGARSLNIELQAALNPAGEKKVERFGWTFAPGDKVMQIENDYDKDVYNGDIGMIEDVDLDEGEVAVNFDGRMVSFVFGELDTLVPAYAATIHKSQGSEYPAVVIPVMTQHYAMLQRNLIYTGVTGCQLRMLSQFAKCTLLRATHATSRKRHCRGSGLVHGPSVSIDIKRGEGRARVSCVKAIRWRRFYPAFSDITAPPCTTQLCQISLHH